MMFIVHASSGCYPWLQVLCSIALDVQASFSKLARQLSRALSSANFAQADLKNLNIKEPRAQSSSLEQFWVVAVVENGW